MAFLLTGQTDAGKSTISGHLLYKVGYFNNISDDDKKLYRKYLESIETSISKSKYSILMDLIDGEILDNKTKTQEFNSCNFVFESNNFQLIDTPGHKLYIKSLVDGLFNITIDCICLVVSSIPTEFYESFEKGTVKEDLLLARSSGCKNLLVLFNKSDVCVATPDLIEQINTFAKKLSFKNIQTLNVSGYTGDGLLKILETIQNIPKTIPTIVDYNYTKKIIVESLIFMSNVFIITSGYKFIIHNKYGHFECTVEKIKGKMMLNSSGTATLLLVFDKEIHTGINDRLIFRNNDTTFGFGNVIKIN